ncbi:MAG: hypothetical protein ABJ013_16145 [Halioglobus sp.]
MKSPRKDRRSADNSTVRKIQNRKSSKTVESPKTAGFDAGESCSSVVASNNTPLAIDKSSIGRSKNHLGKRKLSQVPRRKFTHQSSRCSRWDRLTAKQKLIEATRVMEEQTGEKLWAITWHLSGKFHETIRRSRSTRYLVDETTRVVSAMFPDSALYWFVVEESEEGRIHVHSGFYCSQRQLVELEVKLEKRFCKGLEKSIWGRNRLVYVKPMHDPEGWADYCSKDMWRFSREVGVRKPFYISSQLKEIAKVRLSR